MHRPASSSSSYASADLPADAALSWLTARFDDCTACIRAGRPASGTSPSAPRQAAARRNDGVFEVLGVVATVVGFSGLVQILQAGSPAWDSGVAWWLVVGILGLAVVVAFAVPRVVRHGDDEERTSQGGTR